MFSERAVTVLGESLQRNGELLPVVYSRRPYFAFNVTTVVDALDVEHSRVNRFSSGRVMSIDQFAFKPECVRQRTIFKIPELLRAFVFVTDELVNQVRGAELDGFDFREVWR